MRTSDAIEGIEQMALWTPALIPSDLARWYDASLLTGTPGSTRFASLSDLSGNGKTLTSSRGPLLRQANYSSLTLPSIEFDGASGGDTLGGTSTQTISGFQSACISQAYITRTNMRAFEMSGAVSGSELVGWSGGVFHQNQTPGIKLTLHARTTATKIGAYACIGNAISHAGSPPYTATSVDTSSSYFLHGLFGEVVVTNKTVSTIVYEAIQGYMAWKWKPESAATLLGSGHRYEFNAPTVGPTNTTAPTLYDDGTTDSGVWDSHSGGTITYTTYLYDASDDSLVHTLYTEDADFSSYVTSGDTYYIVVRAANDLGYDSAEDTPSADETIAGGPTYTLSCDASTFTLTGQAAGLRAQRKLTAAAGTYALTGNAASLRSGRKISAATVSFALTGNAATFATSRYLAAAVGTFSVTGNDATLTYTPDGGPDYTLVCDQGAFTLAGAAAGLSAHRKLLAATGSYTLTGIATSLSAQRRLLAASVSFTIAGSDANLIYTPLSGPTYTIGCSSEGYLLTGSSVGLRAQRKLLASHGSYVMAGSAASLSAQRKLAASTGSFVTTGNTAALTAHRKLSASRGVYALTGNPAILVYSGANSATSSLYYYLLLGA
jgi:hypothetical protein